MLKAIPFALFVVVPSLGVGQSVVCAGKIINEGISQLEVTAKCGTPAQVDHRSSSLVRAVGDASRPSYVAGVTTDVDVEVWTYNFGPNKLMQRIWFEDGRVTKVESLGYGF
jgi:hypothetical protein